MKLSQTVLTPTAATLAMNEDGSKKTKGKKRKRDEKGSFEVLHVRCCFHKTFS